MNRAAPSNVERVVVRFAGDSGDGMQVVGDQFTKTSALAGNDIATLPDFPAEIRAPAGTREGVSGFQLHFASQDIFTPGDETDALVAMNPAALVTNLKAVRPGGLVVVNVDRFKKGDLAKARLESNPLEDGTLEGYSAVQVSITDLTKRAVEPFGLNTKEADRCKNFFALGLMYWVYARDVAPTEAWIEGKFKSPYKEANLASLRAGHAYAETVELFQRPVEVARAAFPSGEYRNITGNTALAVGLAAAANRSGRPVFYGSYPITPASDILHALAPFKNHGVLTFQAEDEIAAVCAAIGASYGGSIGVTGTSGPGLALKAEAVGLAVMVELPLVVICVQRGGPSTGLPTKTEQADLLMALHGRNGEAPVPILAPQSPADCFDMAIEAVRIATRYMVPVVLLSDGYTANGSEPWPIPRVEDLPDLRPAFASEAPDGGFLPYARDPETLGRPWAIPGTPGLQHRIGGLEKQDGTGNVSYDPANHERMCKLRAEKVRRIQQDLPPTEVFGHAGGTEEAPEGVLLVGWGSTWGAIRAGTEQLLAQGEPVGHVHLRHLNPLPADLGEVLRRFERVIVPEMNLGQLVRVLRAEYLIDAVPLNKIQGLPFLTREIVAGVTDHLRSAR